MVAVVVIEFSGMRCQPLRRALGFFLENGGNFGKGIYYG
ncbi:acetyltransferase [Vibrio cholerae]|nr:acetyltransferase [Vibrio cholerae]MVC76713.1 acetyltransferase [Vibrio cholerae]